MNTLVENINLSTIVIRPRRVFSCKKCNEMYPRKNVYKDNDGYYRCNRDHSIVEDKTDSETGKDFMEIINI